MAGMLLVGSIRADEPIVHLVIVGDTLDSRIGRSVKVDVETVDMVFRGNVPERQLRIRRVVDREATPEGCLAALESVSPAPNDTVVVYFSGHGAFEAGGAGHVLAPSQRRLPRTTVTELLQTKKHRLSVVLTDCCSAMIEAPVPIPFLPPEETVSPLFDRLFIQPRGLVDVCASRPGESAYGIDGGGGYFTMAFELVCITSKDQSLSWTTMIDQINAEARTIYRMGGIRQIPTAYAVSELPDKEIASDDGEVQPNDGLPRIRLGVRGRDWQGAGVPIVEVFANTPATRLRRPMDDTRYYLVPDLHVIMRVNGIPVSTNAELVQQVGQSPREIHLTVHNRQTGQTREFVTELP